MTFATLCGLEVIRYLAREGAPATGRQISDATGVSKATIYRTLNELVGAGWLHEEGSPRRFWPSWEVTSLGLDLLSQNHVREVALRSLIDLAAESGRPAILAFLHCAETIHTDSVEVVGGRTMPATMHHRAPVLLSSAGRTILSHLPEAETERLIAAGVPRLVPQAPGGSDYVRLAIQNARRTGFGVCDGEVAAEFVSISAALLDGGGRPVGAIGISSPLPRNQVEAEYSDVVCQWARRASIELGYRGSRPYG